MADEIQSGSLENAADLGTTPAATVKRWILELNLADKAEKDWRKSSDAILERYRAEKAKKNSFNILWSITETMRQAIYNTLPKPDVRRRFRDADPVAKVVSEVLERCAAYAIDVYDFDHVLKQDVLDTLLPGRGISRVRYVPSIEGDGTDDERLAHEAVECEHVQWDDFRHGPGKTWEQACWVAFRHRLSRAELKAKFGAVGETVPLDSVADEEVKKADDAVADLFKTLEVWEIWDKDAQQVLFVAKSYKNAPLKVVADPLELDGFYPVARPLYAIEDATTLIPAPLYDKYKEQADELDLVSGRINNLTKALKLRGVYNSVLTEIANLMDAGDNTLMPSQNALALVESGGLEKHIWFMPIEQAANVIKILMEQREACKQVIYEITGIADIMRGATDSRETLGAQQLKSQWGSQRLQRIQREFQRYVRDIIRLKCQVICNKFQPETIIEMTGLHLAKDDQEKQQIQMAAQQFQAYQQHMQQMQQQQGQQQPPMMGHPPQQPTPDQMELLDKPSWQQVIALLKDNVHRTYRIDIETDSTVAESLDSDLAGMGQLVKAIGETMSTMQPLIGSGMLPIDAAKEIMLSVVRRARMGMAVEDAIDKMQPPAPHQDPALQIAQMKQQGDMQKVQMQAQIEQQAKQQDLQMEQARLQMEAQAEQMRSENEMRVAQAEQAYQAQQDQQAQQMEHQREMQRQANEAQMAQMQAVMDQRTQQMQNELQLLIAQLNNAAKVEVAEIAADTTLQSAQISAAKSAESE